MRPSRITLAIFGAMTFASVARAADDECVTAYDASQRHRKGGELVAAHEKLLVCAQPSCPAAVSKECTQWLREVSEALPSVVFGARDARGNDVTQVRVLDGDRVLTERLDGRELYLDPGPHDFRFEFSDKRVLARRVVIRQAEKNRLIEVVEPAPKTTPAPVRDQKIPPKHTAGPPVLAIVLGSVGVLALGSFVYFAIDAKTDIDDLQSCKPGCPQSDVDTAHRKALVADISLGVGVVSLAAAGWLWLSESGNSASNSGVKSLGTGRGLSISGRF